MEENNNSNFLDKNTLIAIVLSILFFVGWQTFLQKKYPEAYKPKEKVAQERKEESLSQDRQGEEKTVEKAAAVESAEQRNDTIEKVVAKEFTFETENWTISLSSKGMGIVSAELNKFTDRSNNKIKFYDPTGETNNFATYYNNKPLIFDIEQKGTYHFVGTASSQGNTLIKEMVFDPDTYTVSVKIKTISGEAGNNDQIETKLANQVLKIKKAMFTPAYEGTEFFAINDGSEERHKINIEKTFAENYEKATLTSIGTHYFAIALNDQSGVIPKTKVDFAPESQVAYASIVHPAATSGNKTDITMTGFVGPKKYDILNKLDPNFVKMINYGMFSILSKPMLVMLKWLYSIFSNWGLAIIFLTISIRMLLLPINISSLKSMKKMQKIQPQLKAIKEKYKEDPQRVNQETMALMKREKANPLGGCLPMLMQLPVFLALYSVLGQSVELYKSPFIFWIKDLSYHDPFFVLPVAVGALYFVQMRLSPSPTDPAQAKVMKFIPILFCFFMITVPSGLTLYFFVNTVFGIGQSFIFQREKLKAAA